MPGIIQQFDEQALVWIAENMRCVLLDPFMKLYTQLGNSGMLFITLGVLLLLFKPTRRAGGLGAVRHARRAGGGELHH